MRAVSFLSLFLLLSCSGAGIFGYRSSGPYDGGLLLGDGTYIQDVTLDSKDGGSHSFRGVFARNKNGVMISAISPEGVSLFRVKDSLDPKRDPIVELYTAEIAARREEITLFYKALRPLFLLEDSSPPGESVFVRERYSDGRPRRLSGGSELELVVDEYDWDGHARKLSLNSPLSSARIVLREYTKEK